MSDFSDRYNDNMKSINDNAPLVYVTAPLIISSINAIIGFIEKHGANTTVAELIGAGLVSEKYAALGAISSGLFLGTMMGSFAVAAGGALASGMEGIFFPGPVDAEDPDRWWKVKTWSGVITATAHKYLPNDLFSGNGICTIKAGKIARANAWTGETDVSVTITQKKTDVHGSLRIISLLKGTGAKKGHCSVSLDPRARRYSISADSYFSAVCSGRSKASNSKTGTNLNGWTLGFNSALSADGPLPKSGLCLSGARSFQTPEGATTLSWSIVGS